LVKLNTEFEVVIDDVKCITLPFSQIVSLETKFALLRKRRRGKIIESEPMKITPNFSEFKKVFQKKTTPIL